MTISNQPKHIHKLVFRGIFILATMLVIFILLGLTRASNKAAQVPAIQLWDLQGRVVGMASFSQTEAGTLIDVTVYDMNPVAGDHGIHIYEVGKCDLPTFESAGGIYNPSWAQHGFNNPAGPMAGDLPVMPFNPDGSGIYQTLTNRFNINDLYDADGSSLIIRASPDNYMTQPDGNSGDRIICGIIAPPQQRAVPSVDEELPESTALPSTNQEVVEVTPEMPQEEPAVQPSDKLGAVLYDSLGRMVGSATLIQDGNFVAVEVVLEDFQRVPGNHRIAITNASLCETPYFTSAGWEIAVLPDMQLFATGNAYYEAVLPDITTASLLDWDGSAFVIYANSGDAPGERIICGPLGPLQDILNERGVSDIKQLIPSVDEELPESTALPSTNQEVVEVTPEMPQEQPAVQPSDKLGAVLYDSLGRMVGAATLIQGGNLVGVDVVLEDLQRVPGNHRIAITSASVCETPDFTTAGWEISVLPDMQLFATGYAYYEAVSDWFTTASLLDWDGSALVIYADSGDAPGERIICGPLGPLQDILNGLGVSDIKQLIQ